MKRLIVNGDDYAYTSSVSKGIREAHQKGIVTATSAFMNTATVLRDLAIAKSDCPKLGLGIHLNLTMGKPILPPEEIITLVDENGWFFSKKKLFSIINDIKIEQVEKEWRAQIELFLSNGYKLDHVDSHHNISYITNRLFNLMLKLAKEYHFPIRCPTEDLDNINALKAFQKSSGIVSPDRTIISFFKKGVSASKFVKILNNLQNGISELVCHPGYANKELVQDTKYSYIREKELQIIINRENKKLLEENNIKLTKYKDI